MKKEKYCIGTMVTISGGIVVRKDLQKWGQLLYQ